METIFGIIIGIVSAATLLFVLALIFDIEFIKSLFKHAPTEVDYGNPIKEMLEFKRAERHRLLVQWDEEYLSLLPVGKERVEEHQALMDKLISNVSIFNKQPTEKETDEIFSMEIWQKEMEKYYGGYIFNPNTESDY